ncbi:hypothetical protein EZS27_017588 [termite gut metagenome]|uniref:Uncharacterized protein n=1 Tax=termite gut metagenome TaxID=433724 RepID=A0A5J4RLV7_9ZZZZ
MQKLCLQSGTFIIHFLLFYLEPEFDENSVL